MKPTWIRLASAFLVIACMAAFVAIGCKSRKDAAQPAIDSSRGSTGSPGARLQRGSGYAHITYRPNVRIMEQDEGKKALIGVSTDEASLLFDGSNEIARSLKAGDVLIIKGVLARVVLGAEQTPMG